MSVAPETPGSRSLTTGSAPGAHTLHRLTIHGMNSFECYDLGNCGVRSLKQLSEMADVIVAEDELWHSTVANPLDHGGMVPRIRVNLTA